MSAIDDLLEWYRLAELRRDGNWAPSELQHAAEDQLIAEAAAVGTVLHRDDAHRTLMDEVYAQQATRHKERSDTARALLKGASAAPVRRTPGRPPGKRDDFHWRFHEAERDIGRPAIADEEIADHMLRRSKGQVTRGISLRHLQRLIQKHGRPSDTDTD